MRAIARAARRTLRVFVTAALDAVLDHAAFLNLARSMAAPSLAVSGADTPPRSPGGKAALEALLEMAARCLPAARSVAGVAAVLAAFQGYHNRRRVSGVIRGDLDRGGELSRVAIASAASSARADAQ
jgi:hypothetical protein